MEDTEIWLDIQSELVFVVQVEINEFDKICLPIFVINCVFVFCIEINGYGVIVFI